jgi:drug/metabolite transporter (DMT)-like permease
MDWFILAMAGAFCQALYNLSIKVLLQTIRPYQLAGYSFLSGSLVLFFISLLHGIPILDPGFLSAVAVTVGINTIATILFYRALSITDLSLCTPMLAFTPVFLIVTSFLILGEIPSFAGIVGILIVTAGAYLLNLEYKDPTPSSLKTPLRMLAHHRGVQGMLLVAFLYSISVNYDKQVVETSDPIFGSAIVLLLLGVTFLVCDVWSGNRGSGSIQERTRGSWKQHRVFPAIGLILALEGITINFAYTMEIVPYVIAVKRLAIFFSVLFGGFLLAERPLAGRMIGAVVMIAGTVVIGIWG